MDSHLLTESFGEARKYFLLQTALWCRTFRQDSTARLRRDDVEKKTLNFLIFQYRFDILLEIRFNGVAEQEYTGLYGKSQLKKWGNNCYCITAWLW